MKDADIQNLLGGFATDTLTAQERQLLASPPGHLVLRRDRPLVSGM